MLWFTGFCSYAVARSLRRELNIIHTESNLAPRAHVSFGQRRVLALTKRHVGSGNKMAQSPHSEPMGIPTTLVMVVLHLIG